MFPSLNPEDLGIIILVAIIAVWAIVFKILNNRRQVVRHVLHGTVTYTIKGYSGPEAYRIARSLQKDEPGAEVLDPALPKATAKDIRA